MLFRSEVHGTGDNATYTFSLEVTLSDSSTLLVAEDPSSNNGDGNGLNDRVGAFASYGGAYDNSITISLTDKAGLTTEENFDKALTYALCGQGTWFSLDPISAPSPSSILPRHIMLGLGSINLPLYIN